MLKWILLTLALLTGAAQAQAPQTIPGPYTGTSVTTTGYNIMTGGTLFMPNSAALQANAPLSFAIDIQTPSANLDTTEQIIVSAFGTSSTNGFFLNTFPSSLAFPLQFSSINETSFNCFYQACTRVNPTFSDGNWHTICGVLTATSTFLQVDNNILSDGGYPPFEPTYLPSTTYWNLGNTIVSPGTATNLNVNVREGAFWNRPLTSQDCSTIYYRHQAGKTLNSGSLLTGLVDYWSFANCTSSGCAAVVGSDNWIFDTAPTCSITAPSNGASGLTGSQTVTVSSTDNIGITSVDLFIDNAFFEKVTTSPYNFTWGTTNYIDGSHSLYAVCTNVAGVTTTSSAITASTSNSVSAKTVYINPSTGSDSNSCLASGSPCKTLAGIQTIINGNPLHGGDTIAFAEGTTLDITDLTTASTLTLAGPLAGGLVANAPSQNVYPGKTITWTTYGGGTCAIMSGTTSGCGTITLSANGSVPRNAVPIAILNVPNFQMSNIRIIGSQTNAIICNNSPATVGCSYGLTYSFANNYVSQPSSSDSATQFTNLEIVDFWNGFAIGNNWPPYTNYTSTGPCGVTVNDNYVHGSSITSQMVFGIEFSGNVFAGSTTGPCYGDSSTADTSNSNFVQWVGGFVTGPGVGAAVGLDWTSQQFNSIAKFNAIGNLDYNSGTCGAGYSFETFETTNVTLIGNEAYNNFPTGNYTGCDNGGFDFDEFTLNAASEYNYGHQFWGPAQSMPGTFGGSNGGPATLAYNIFEDGGMDTGTQLQSAAVFLGAGTGASNSGYIFNNTIWNGYNGTTSLAGGLVRTPNWLMSNCPGTGGVLYATNNILVAPEADTGDAYMGRGGLNGFCTASQFSWQNDDYYNLSGTLTWVQLVGATTPTSLAQWVAVSGETGAINSNPAFNGSGGAAVVCYSPLASGGSAPSSGAPVQPGAIPCPTNYKLTGSSSAVQGTGIAPSSWTALPTTDYYTSAIPNSHGSGYNMGAYGAYP